MKYYVVEISFGDPAIAGKGVYEYATEKEAVATFHQKMGTAMKSDLYTGNLLMVIDDFGNVIMRERYADVVEAAAE